MHGKNEQLTATSDGTRRSSRVRTRARSPWQSSTVPGSWEGAWRIGNTFPASHRPATWTASLSNAWWCNLQTFTNALKIASKQNFSDITDSHAKKNSQIFEECVNNDQVEEYETTERVWITAGRQAGRSVRNRQERTQHPMSVPEIGTHGMALVIPRPHTFEHAHETCMAISNMILSIPKRFNIVVVFIIREWTEELRRNGVE